MATLTVNVTQEHIDNGLRGIKCDCPIALALFPVLGRVEVYRMFVDTYTPVGKVYIDLPEVAQDFIEAYDDGAMHLEPFTFQLYYVDFVKHNVA